MKNLPDMTDVLELLDVVYEMVALRSTISDNVSDVDRAQQFADLWNRVSDACAKYSSSAHTLISVRPDERVAINCGKCGERVDCVTYRALDNNIATQSGVWRWDETAAKFVQLVFSCDNEEEE